MESNGIKGRINLSEDSKNLLETDPKGEMIEFDEHETVKIDVPNFKKDIKMYLIKESIDDDQIKKNKI